MSEPWLSACQSQLTMFAACYSRSPLSVLAVLSISPRAGRAWLSVHSRFIIFIRRDLDPGPGSRWSDLTIAAHTLYSRYPALQPRVRLFSLNIETKLAGLLNYRARGVPGLTRTLHNTWQTTQQPKYSTHCLHRLLFVFCVASLLPLLRLNWWLCHCFA